MIGRGDEHRVESLVRQQVVIVEVTLSALRRFQSKLEIRLIDIGNRDALRSQILKYLAHGAAAAAGPDEPVADAIVCAPRLAGRQRGRGEECSSVHLSSL